MTTPVNTNTLSKLLWPGVNKIISETLPQYKDIYTEYFKTEDMGNRNWAEDVSMSGFGLLSVKGEGAPVQYDAMKQGFTTRYIPSVVAGGFQITREAMDDLQYKTEISKKARALVKAEKHTRETFAANVLNRAFTSTYAGGDGKELCATDHPNAAGGTWSNELATPAAMSEATLEDMCLQVWRFTDDRGLKANLQTRKLIIPQDLIFDTERILTSVKRINTANNDPNVLKDMGKIPEGWVAVPWLTSATAFFILTDADDGLKYWERNAPEYKADNDFDAEIAKFKVRSRYVFGWSEARIIIGNLGA